MRRNWLCVLFACVLAVSLAGCSVATTPATDAGTSEGAAATKLDAFKDLKGEMVVGGATTLEPLAKAVCERITAKYPDVKFTIEGGGSEVGVQKTGEGVMGVGLVTRDLEDKEKQAYADIKVYPFANEGLGVVVNSANAVSALTPEQAAGIFSGKIKDWSEVGGKAGAINVYQRDETQAGRKQLQKYLKIDAFGPAKSIPAETQDMHDLVAADANGIGYIGFSVGSDKVKFIELEGVKPVEENVANGTWVMIRTERLLTKGEPTGLAKAYVEYFMSPECEDLVKDSGFLPLKK